jgi:2-methylisocitrate lyase-like PEP mutase family enzyme
MRASTVLKQAMAPGACVMAPGVADCAMARLVASLGFPALYMTGSGTAAVRLGQPDIGLLTMTEMADNAARIVDAAGLPLVADADDGYGNPLNVRRAVRSYERAGVAALHIEDQVSPKRCGHFGGKRLIAPRDMQAKIQAAVEARTDADLQIIARTDALAVDGLEAALDRAAAYAEAGADVTFVEAPRTEAEIERIGRTLTVPQLFNMSTSGKTPHLPADRMAALNFRIAIYPNYVLYAALAGARSLLLRLKQSGSTEGLKDGLPSFAEFNDLMGMQDVRALEARYAVPDEARTEA